MRHVIPGEDGPAPVRRSRTPTLLRQIPGDTPLHRLWAGTKLLTIVAIAVLLSVWPTWQTIGLFAALLVACAVVGHIPRGAVPVPPRLLVAVMLAGALLTLASGGKPEVAVFGGHVGFGDLELYVRFTCLAVVVLGGSAMVAWTTALGDLAPALVRLWRPLRVLRLPVDEWAVVVALCVRSLPLLFDELRILLAARRLRARPTQRRSVDDWLEELIDVMTASLAASIRRAGELGEAITARGGTGQLSASDSGPGAADAAALTIVAALVAVAIVVNVL
jgi:energy-coupling factor transport system permease protein